MPDRNDEVNLLIVDDLPENLLALDALLQAPGVRVHQAESAEQALELLLRHEFALAILDVQMPGMDGFQLAELMRGTERTKQIPIVFVSAAGRELNYAFKGYESGAVDFMHKPLDAHAVRSKVSVFVDLYAATATFPCDPRARWSSAPAPRSRTSTPSASSRRRSTTRCSVRSS